MPVLERDHWLGPFGRRTAAKKVTLLSRFVTGCSIGTPRMLRALMVPGHGAIVPVAKYPAKADIRRADSWG
jgi:hypothetical protein